jgi:hypothetical protein
MNQLLTWVMLMPVAWTEVVSLERLLLVWLLLTFENTAFCSSEG